MQHCAQSVDVRRFALGKVVAQLLWRHVEGSATLLHFDPRGAESRGAQLTDPEVPKDRTIRRAKEDVLGFDVSMRNVVGMAVGDALANAMKYLEESSHRDAALKD